MRIYVFVSEKDLDVVGFTFEETGSNLPATYNPWREEVEPGIFVVETDHDPISEAVRRHGFYVFPGWNDC